MAERELAFQHAGYSEGQGPQFKEVLESAYAQYSDIEAETEPKENAPIRLLHILGTVHSFMLVRNCRDQVIANNNNKVAFRNPGAKIFSDATGLSIHPNQNPVEGMLKAGPELLISAHQSAKEQGKES